MRKYFSQFGTITKLRLSRNRKTGAPKQFAFFEFESDEVARIVAKTMDNYLMFGHILKCKYAPQGSLHKDLWKGANKRFKKVPWDKIEKRSLEAPKTAEQWQRKVAKEQKKREEKAKKLKAMGYEIELPKMKSPEAVLEQRKLDEKAQASQPTLVPKDEVSLKRSKEKKSNISKAYENDIPKDLDSETHALRSPVSPSETQPFKVQPTKSKKREDEQNRKKPEQALLISQLNGESATTVETGSANKDFITTGEIKATPQLPPISKDTPEGNAPADRGVEKRKKSKKSKKSSKTNKKSSEEPDEASRPTLLPAVPVQPPTLEVSKKRKPQGEPGLKGILKKPKKI